MTDYLRSIALSVDEPDPGVYHWVLMESTEDAAIFGPLSASEESFSTWSDALHAGVAALELLAQDEKMGPRAELNGRAIPMANCGFSALPDEGAIDGD